MTFRALKTHELLRDLHALETDLPHFEKKYGMPSDAFYSTYMQGEEPNDDSHVLDFAEWASIYRTWHERLAMYREKTSFFEQ